VLNIEIDERKINSKEDFLLTVERISFMLVTMLLVSVRQEGTEE